MITPTQHLRAVKSRRRAAKAAIGGLGAALSAMSLFLIGFLGNLPAEWRAWLMLAAAVLGCVGVGLSSAAAFLAKDSGASTIPEGP